MKELLQEGHAREMKSKERLGRMRKKVKRLCDNNQYGRLRECALEYPSDILGFLHSQASSIEGLLKTKESIKTELSSMSEEKTRLQQDLKDTNTFTTHLVG